MASSRSGTSSSRKNNKCNFTDAESSLLLKAAYAFKVEQSAKGTDWNTCKTKFDEILPKFIESYPDEETADELHFPNFASKNEVFTKKSIQRKLQKLKEIHKKAVAANSKSGRGRLCILLWDDLTNLFGRLGSGAALPNGVSTETLNDSASPPPPNVTPPDETAGTDEQNSGEAASFDSTTSSDGTDSHESTSNIDPPTPDAPLPLGDPSQWARQSEASVSEQEWWST